MTADTLRIEYMPLTTLTDKRHPRNPKDHDIGAISRSVNRFGFTSPVILDERTERLAAGHGRIDTLAQLKAQGKQPPANVQVKGDDWLIPVVRGVAFNSDAEIEAYLIADNRLTILGGWDEPELAGLLQELAAQDAELFEATGYDGDDLQALLDELDMVDAPPPGDVSGVLDRADELRELWGANYFADKLPVSSCWICWDKREDITRNNFADCELAWVNQDKPARLFHHLWNGLHKGSQNGERRIHPTEKPVALFREIGMMFSPEGIWVDLFAGSGAQIVAAEQAKATCLALEYEPLYVACILQRLKDMGLEPRLVDDDGRAQNEIHA